MTKAVDARFAPFRTDDALLGFLGAAEWRADPSGCVLRLTPALGAANPMGIIHGGALSTLCDVAMYEAAKLAAAAECVTVAQEMKFLRAASGDAPLVVTADVLKSGRRAVFCTAHVHQGDRLIAQSTGQFAPL